MAISARRSTFTLKNALRFKKIFDIAVRDKKDLLINIKSGASITAFHTKCSDALKWLITYQDNEHVNTLGVNHIPGSYQALRGGVKFKIFEDKNDGNKIKIRLAFFANELIQDEYIGTELVTPSDEDKLVQVVQDNNTTPDKWKKDLIKGFVENEEMHTSGKIFKLKNLNLTLEDQQWAKDILSQMDYIVYDIDTDMIIAKVNVDAKNS